MIIAFSGYLTLLSCGFLSLYLIRICRKPEAFNALKNWVVCHGLLLLAAFLILTYGFITDTWSIAYVAQHSHSALPLIYKICAVWGGHEGSLLLWVSILSLWMVVMILYPGPMSQTYLRLSIGILCVIAAGFEWFMIVTSNPFLVLPITPLDGADLNPLLQDPGMVSHPPMLYMGYVGFSVVYACAIAGMLSKEDRPNWSAWARPWALAAWASLTVGIVLGSAWAYRELGWGGWWFWDPVENASFMPWLVGVGLIHSLILAQRQPDFTHWAGLLAIFGFILSLLGTFLVRSGILISVHAFAVDATRGIYLLGFLGVVLCVSLFVLLKTYQRQSSLDTFDWHAKPKLLMFNNVMFLFAMLVVVLGTLFPILYQFITNDPLSIGPPYFNSVLWPVVVLLMVLMGLAVQANWFGLNWEWRVQIKVILAALLIALAISFCFSTQLHFHAMLSLTLIFWLILMHRQHWLQLNFQRLPMLIAHLGFIVTALGITLTSQFSEEHIISMKLGETVTSNQTAVTWKKAASYEGDNFWAMKMYLNFHTKNGFNFDLHPEYRVYTASKTPLPHASIAPFIWGDYYVNVGQSIGDGAWLIRWQFKPFVRWIWLGGFLMAAGGILSMRKKRYAS